MLGGELDLTVYLDWQRKAPAVILTADPIVWTTSDRHRTHERSPLAVATYTKPVSYQDFVLRSLKTSGRDYRVAFLSDCSAGLRMAVASGIAIAPLCRSNIPPGSRELTAAEGFLSHSCHLGLHVREDANDGAILELADAIRAAFQVR
ncbi:hypothetical protein AU467_20255 [Mesorhizobium loti]|uniref:LysR substrate-binding domain-containing protein n=1 Tax=Rhizobium loti TaxID=381 RepID=A0A101KTR8_RHILI|nr:hypothetical protein AU467_20255 [Mesorhizobium loti]